MEATLSEPSRGGGRAFGKRILIADDTVSSRDLLRSILEGIGHEVLDAEDGIQVLERAIVFLPALVILDVHIPKLDGYAAATALRKIAGFEQVPLIALIAALVHVAPEKIADAGFSAYLVKPIVPAHLRQCVANLI